MRLPPFAFAGEDGLLRARSFLKEYFEKSSGYDNSLKHMELESVAPESLRFRIEVLPSLCNGGKTLHGGASATLVDMLTSVHLIAVCGKPGVSTDLPLQYLSAAPLNSTVHCITSVDKIGKTLAFTSLQIKDSMTGKLIAKGSHTKFMGKSERLPTSIQREL